jgi:hypothetical protein
MILASPHFSNQTKQQARNLTTLCSSHHLSRCTPFVSKIMNVLGFKICPKNNDVLLYLARVHVHVAMQQSISI